MFPLEMMVPLAGHRGSDALPKEAIFVPIGAKMPTTCSSQQPCEEDEGGMIPDTKDRRVQGKIENKFFCAI